MRLIVGMDRNAADWTVIDLHKAGPCSSPADDEADAPRIYWPAELWPEVLALIAFDQERQRLGLPTIEALNHRES